MLIPPEHSWIPGLVILAYISGAMLILAGACIVFEKKTRPISLLLGSVLLLIFCFYFIPYEFMASSNYMHLGEWENAEKELALSGGAFVIAGCFSEKNENPLIRFLGKLIPFGAIFFSITMISFGIDHFLYAKDAADYVPIMGTQPYVLDLFCRHSINWFRHCDYFENQARINCHSFGDNDFYLVYYSPHPQSDSFSFC